jgi:hypothetical protein
MAPNKRKQRAAAKKKRRQRLELELRIWKFAALFELLKIVELILNR